MVKFITTFLSVFFGVVCFCQEKKITTHEVDFNAYFSKDKVCFNDTVKISLFYINKTGNDDQEIFFPINSRIFSTAIGHEPSDYFISEDSSSRILYNLQDTTDNDSIVILKPSEKYIKTYKVIIRPTFFL